MKTRTTVIVAILVGYILIGLGLSLMGSVSDLRWQEQLRTILFVTFAWPFLLLGKIFLR